MFFETVFIHHRFQHSWCWWIIIFLCLLFLSSNFVLNSIKIKLHLEENWERRSYVYITAIGKVRDKENPCKYLKSLITCNGSCTDEVRSRITMRKKAIIKVSTLITARLIPISFRKSFAKSFIHSMVITWFWNHRSSRKKRRSIWIVLIYGYGGGEKEWN